MNAKERHTLAQQHAPEDLQVDSELASALRNFRLSVHHWSDQEFIRPRDLKRSRRAAFQARFWSMIANPAIGGTMAAVLLLGSVGIPLGIHHEREIEQQRQAALDLEKHQAEKATKADLAAGASNGDDGAFLDDVDSDIAQAAPDAMQPLASLMNDTAAAPARR